MPVLGYAVASFGAPVGYMPRANRKTCETLVGRVPSPANRTKTSVPVVSPAGTLLFVVQDARRKISSYVLKEIESPLGYPAVAHVAPPRNNDRLRSRNARRFGECFHFAPQVTVVKNYQSCCMKSGAFHVYRCLRQQHYDCYRNVLTKLFTSAK